VIADPIDNRRLHKLEPIKRRRCGGATQRQKQIGQRPVTPAWHAYRKELAHILDCGGIRRTTLRGWENLNKRFNWPPR